MIRDKILQYLKWAIVDLHNSGELKIEKGLISFKIGSDFVEFPKIKEHGDYATNIAFRLGARPSKKPIEIAKILKKKLWEHKGLRDLFEDIKIIEPGFINFFVSKEYLRNQVSKILKEKDKFGNLKFGKKEKVNIEFISANPTGPLTLGNGRGGFCGDVLANVLEKAGYDVCREYYINDRGKQIEDLKKGLYKGEKRTALQIQKENQKLITRKLKIKFDVWFSEKSLYKKGEVDKILNWLKNKRLTYEKNGALWFKSTKFGDDKDRVLVKADGEKTYFASDIAYLKNKFKRGFKNLIFFWGADHYGYVKRIEAATEALGYKKEQADFIIMQLVRLFEKGKHVRMSKRAGTYVTLEELIDQVSLSAARFFFLTRSSGSHLNFDLDLAKEQSEKNPVYYVQYAHARICSILRKLKAQSSKLKATAQNLKLLNHPSELKLIKQLVKFPKIIEDTAKDYQTQRLPQYSIDLATALHQFYRDCKVLSDDKELTKTRLSLISATKVVLKNTLNLMGISAPSKM